MISNPFRQKKSSLQKYKLPGALLFLLLGGLSYILMRQKSRKDLLVHEPQWEKATPVIPINTRRKQERAAPSLGRAGMIRNTIVSTAPSEPVIIPEVHDEGIKIVAKTANAKESGQTTEWDFPDSEQVVEIIHKEQEAQLLELEKDQATIINVDAQHSPMPASNQVSETREYSKWGLPLLAIVALAAIVYLMIVFGPFPALLA